MRLVIQLYDPWPSRNELDKMHHMKKYHLGKEVEAEIGGEVLANLDRKEWVRAGRPYFRRVEMYRIGRIKDHDNLVGGVKLILDAMVRLDLIRDDSMDVIDIEIKQFASPWDRTILMYTGFRGPASGSIIILKEVEK